MALTPVQERTLAEALARFVHDPLGCVMFLFPWGQPGTPLADHKGPREWQRKLLASLGEQLRAKKGDRNRLIQEAVASGHGIGKSAFIAMLMAWAMSTMGDTKGIITAGTEAQLKTKTWPEITKWFRMMLNAHWFTVEETSIYSNAPGHKATWRFDRVTWNKTQPEAFAGLHNEGRRIVVFFDEASQIDDKIWEVTDGALTDENTEIIFCVFGNPTRNTGAFRRCFGAERHRWSRGEPLQIDSRTVEGTNKQYLSDLVKEYGEDSDRVKVRVRGLFPSASSLQFISESEVLEAQKRPARCELTDPLIMALDVARGGDDDCIFRFRRGLDGRSIPPVKVPGSEAKGDNNRLVTVASELIRKHQPDAFFVDGTGVGGYLINWLRSLNIRVQEVQFGAASPDEKCLNMRTYMWARMREWLKIGGAIDDSAALAADLTGIEYDHDMQDRLRLERKEHMKDRGLASPDHGDALAMTFAYHVAPKNYRQAVPDQHEPYDPLAILYRQDSSANQEYDPHANLR